MWFRMAFQNLTENPQESIVGITILGLLLAQELNAIEVGVLGRVFIYLGEVLATISILMTAQEATVGKADTIKTDGDDISAIISKLQQQNQYLQEQIWELQKNEHKKGCISPSVI